MAVNVLTQCMEYLAVQSSFMETDLRTVDIVQAYTKPIFKARLQNKEERLSASSCPSDCPRGTRLPL